MAHHSRRDFLKISGAFAAGALMPESLRRLGSANNKPPNIIIILCDAFSAKNISLHGYPRLTTPNIDAFAERATVYHSHYSGGNFTATGTASMLTGMHAWKHRAINYAGLVRPEFIGTNPYSLLGPDYYRFAFSQNIWPDRLIGQYSNDVDRFLPPSAYSRLESSSLDNVFKNDHSLASIAVEDFLFPEQTDVPPGSALLGYLNKSRVLNLNKELINPRYPKGFPEIMPPGFLIPYLNEDVYDGVRSEILSLDAGNQPYFAYFHLWSPHFPYKPRQSYQKLYRGDGYIPPMKPIHPLSVGLQEDFLLAQRVLYDRQIAQVDEEFGRLVAELGKNGILENSYLMLTSDHGELFERGFIGHGFNMMYEPVLRIPLIVHAPGQIERTDVFSLTSNIDILPTLLSIAGKDIPPEVDGILLPGLGGNQDETRTIFSMAAVDNSAFRPIHKAVIAMRKQEYKLIAYLGYEEVDPPFELYDLENDPEELNNLWQVQTGILNLMKDELFDRLNAANETFARG